MKKFYYIAILITIVGCNPDGAGCFKPTGSLETVSTVLADYSTIKISGNIDVRLTNGLSKGVKLTAGRNLIQGIRMEVIEGVLYLDNLNTCNWTRKYINPVVEITNPDLIEIVQQGSGKVISTETLTYDQLKLESSGGAGEYNLEVNIRSLAIVSNEVANYYLSGSVDELRVGFYSSDGIFYGEKLLTNDCVVTHQGSNTIHLNVANSLSGGIYSLGNVILHQQMPTSVDVEETNSGKLIYQP